MSTTTPSSSSSSPETLLASAQTFMSTDAMEKQINHFKKTTADYIAIFVNSGIKAEEHATTIYKKLHCFFDTFDDEIKQFWISQRDLEYGQPPLIESEGKDKGKVKSNKKDKSKLKLKLKLKLKNKKKASTGAAPPPARPDIKDNKSSSSSSLKKSKGEKRSLNDENEKKAKKKKEEKEEKKESGSTDDSNDNEKNEPDSNNEQPNGVPIEQKGDENEKENESIVDSKTTNEHDIESADNDNDRMDIPQLETTEKEKEKEKPTNEVKKTKEGFFSQTIGFVTKKILPQPTNNKMKITPSKTAPVVQQKESIAKKMDDDAEEAD